LLSNREGKGLSQGMKAPRELIWGVLAPLSGLSRVTNNPSPHTSPQEDHWLGKEHQGSIPKQDYVTAIRLKIGGKNEGVLDTKKLE